MYHLWPDSKCRWVTTGDQTCHPSAAGLLVVRLTGGPFGYCQTLMLSSQHLADVQWNG